MKTPPTDFEPFGPEWQKEMMKFKKEELIAWLRTCLINQKSIDEAYQSGYNDATREACEEIAKNYQPNTK